MNLWMLLLKSLVVGAGLAVSALLVLTCHRIYVQPSIDVSIYEKNMKELDGLSKIISDRLKAELISHERQGADIYIVSRISNLPSLLKTRFYIRFTVKSDAGSYMVCSDDLVSEATNDEAIIYQTLCEVPPGFSGNVTDISIAAAHRN